MRKLQYKTKARLLGLVALIIGGQMTYKAVVQLHDKGLLLWSIPMILIGLLLLIVPEPRSRFRR